MINVSDLKQYLYCPRVVWYRYCQPVPRNATYKMEHGREAGRHVAELEERRSLRAYGVASGDRSFEVWLESERMGVCGQLDMLITTADERVPVEFKFAGRVAANHRYQLALYALLLEEIDGPPVNRGFVYLIPAKRATELVVSTGMRAYVTRALAEMREMIAQETYPRPTGVQARHRDCEFRAYCMDVR